MCGIYGALGHPLLSDLFFISALARDRGRDGGRMEVYELAATDDVAMLGNWRATPTTELERGKLQPYDRMVHNGTIANDRELGAQPGEIDSEVLARVIDRRGVQELAASLARVRGSYALAVQTGETVLLAANYKPLHFYRSDTANAVYFASMERHLAPVVKPGHRAAKLEPYSVLDLRTWASAQIPREFSKRAVVIASAGLDSTTVATKLIHDGYEVHLVHFLYGCNAQDSEAHLIPQIARRLGCDYTFLPIDPTMFGTASRIMNDEAELAPGIDGAEWAHEWVPARNLVMLAHATAFAEANGYHVVALGNNLEESGAYPDNEEEFTNLFNQLLPNAVHDGYKVSVVWPVGNLMKHEIVKLGVDLGAPLDVTWSCYRDGKKHCGACGPCFMRRTAFARNGLQDPVFR